jgi:putative inorganic carbon (HCO3(-)) transporter
LATINKHNKAAFWRLNWLVSNLGWPLILGILVLLALGAGFLAANGLALVTFGVVGALFCALVAFKCFMDPVRGYYLLIFCGFFSEYPGRLLNRALPLTTFVEALVLVLFIGTYWHAKNDENQKGSLLRYSISILLIIYTLFYIVELFNPDMHNPWGWLFNSKRFTMQLLFYVISYRLINTPERFRYFMKFWIVMAFIAAAYGCYQQWFGMLPRELSSIDPHEYGLLFQGGVIRKFSFLEGVVTFGNLCGCFAVITIILALNEKVRRRKYQLGFISVILFLGMSYSGTRTFTLMIPAGMALYILMSLRNKATLMTLFVTFMSVLFILFAPIDNPTLNRMRSTFNTKEESLTLRTFNRHSIQPYVYAHPFGGGVATSGVEGMRFNPDHPLAGFPPDSGLLKIALDMGWIGLGITMLVFLWVLYQGIYYYFQIKNEEYKKYIVAVTCALFAVIITLYAQVTIGQMPTVFFIFGMMALFKRLKEWDEEEILIKK